MNSLTLTLSVFSTLVVLSSGYTNNNNNDYDQWTPNHNTFGYQPRTLREGQECTEEGFFRDAEDCQKFYRCAMLPQAIGNKITRYEFRCPDGTVFDEQIATCNYANQMNNPPQNCRADNPPPQQVQVPAIPGQGGSGSGDGSQQQFPQVPSQQQPQVPGIQQPQVPSVQQPQAPSNPGSGSGSGNNPQQPGQQTQVPNFPNQQIPGGFPNQPGQGQPQQPQVFFLPGSGQMWYYVPQHQHQQQMQQNRPPITFGRL